MQPTASATQGLPAILQALATGGAPMGAGAQAPGPMAPLSISNPPGNPLAIGTPAASPQTSATDPAQIQAILQALMQNGVFNKQSPTNVA